MVLKNCQPLKHIGLPPGLIESLHLVQGKGTILCTAVGQALECCVQHCAVLQLHLTTAVEQSAISDSSVGRQRSIRDSITDTAVQVAPYRHSKPGLNRTEGQHVKRYASICWGRPDAQSVDCML